MCVTNTTHRRSQPISLPQQQEGCPSGFTQRLMGTFQFTVPAKPQGLAIRPAELTVVAHDETEKSRPKRRRKPQKPGKTAKMNDRHFVVHNYHDHAVDSGDCDDEQEQDEHSRRKGGVAVAFPLKLHAILDQVERDGLGHVISWQGHGRCFVIHLAKEFVNTVMPKYFRQTKLTSFQRQLNLYGFCRLTRGDDAGGYYHELFLRGMQFLCKRMIRTKVKGTRFKAASSPDQEPDFYSMPPVVVTPSHSPHGSPQHQSQAFMSDDSSRDTMSTAPLAAPAPIKELYSRFFNSQQESQSAETFEPYPIQQQHYYPQMPMPMAAAVSSYDSAAMAAAVSSFEPAAAPIPFSSNPADQVLDEAVDELFLDSSTYDLAAEMNDLDDFVKDWDPANNFTKTLNNDMALGFMLDKLLED